MHRVIQYSLIFGALFIFTSAAMGDAFDQTVDRIKILEVELEQNQADIDEKQSLIEIELRTFRTNHALNAPKGEFESDADYAARLRRLAAAVAQRRAELEEKHLPSLRADRLETQTEISRLYGRAFFTNDVTVTLGRYNANAEYFPITFVVNNERVDVRLYISKQNDAPTLKSNWDKVVKTAYISIDPGYRKALVKVKLEYPPLWKYGYSWRFIELYNLGDGYQAVAFSPNGKYIATGRDRIVKRTNFSFYIRGSASIWNLSNGRELRHMELDKAVYSVAFSPNGQYLATGDSAWINLWNINNGTNIWTKSHDHNSDIFTVAFSPDGRYLATGSSLGVIVFRVSDGRQFWGRSRGGSYRAGFYTAAYSPDGQYLATGDSFNDTILWDASTGTIVHTIKHTDEVRTVAFSPDGKYLATGDQAGNLSICEVNNGLKILAENLSTNQILVRIDAIAYSPDGQFIAVRMNRTLKSSNYTYPAIYFYQIPRPPINVESSLRYASSITVIGSKPTWDKPELAWHPNGRFISDGNKVYRTPLHSEEVNLISTTILSSVIDPVKTGIQFTLDFTVKDVTDLAGWQTDVMFNPDALSVVETKEGNFLKTDGRTTFFHEGNIDNTTGKVTGLSGAILGGSVSGEGTLFSITFEAKAAGDGQLQLLATQLSTLSAENIPHELVIHPIVIEDRPLFEDVNKDKIVNIQDLVLVASRFGEAGPSDGDVNGDGVVNIQDLVMVAAALGTTAAAPSLYDQSSEMLTAADVRQWLAQAQQLNLTDVTSQRGILFLEQLLATLTPKETALLPNYPNPFNPETWIPYQLAEFADVKISIYTADGKLVRTLDLGRKPVGIYHHRSSAAYWDGKNGIREPVASGVYFYTLTADEFTATRKMLIRK